jgi:hypothetical protein
LKKPVIVNKLPGRIDEGEVTVVGKSMIIKDVSPAIEMIP